MYYFTAEIIFLGVTVTKFSKKLETNLYCKPTNTQHYLHAQHAIKDLFHMDRLQGLKEFNSDLGQLKKWLVKRG